MRKIDPIPIAIAAATAAPGEALGGNLSANFRWNCENGVLDGQVLLAPTNSPTLQALCFAAKPRPAQ